MRFHLSSLDRTKQVAKNLCRIVGAIHQIDLPQTASRNILALMLGYRDWNEMKSVTERHDEPPSPFDELLEPGDLRLRLAAQATILAAAVGIDEDAAARTIASCRPTAHPAGPHRLFGPSSLPPPYAVEYRGHADGLALTTITPSDGRRAANPRGPFATDGAESLKRIVMGLADYQGAGEVSWRRHASALLDCAFLALTWKRDRGQFSLTAGTARDHLDLACLIGLADPALEPEMPPLMRFLIDSYCNSLRGYRKTDGVGQARAVLAQHADLQGPLAIILEHLDETFGHVFLVPSDVTPVRIDRCHAAIDPEEMPQNDADEARRIIRETTTKVYMRVPTDAAPNAEETTDVVKHDGIEYEVTKFNMR